MQRIEFTLFKSFFEKNLTGNEIDFIIALSHLQDERGEVSALHYKEMMNETGMSVQAFYDCKRSLQDKGIIRIQKGMNDYDITLIGNDFSRFSNADYNSGKVKYISTNRKIFYDQNWKKLKPAQKLLAMDLLNINIAGNRTHRIDRKKFIEKYANGTNPDGTIRKGLLNVCERTLQKYLKMLKLYFYIALKDGMYLITLRSYFAKKVVSSEHEVTYKRLIQAACRRNRIKEQDQREAKGILALLCGFRKELIQHFVYIPDLFKKMLEILNVRVQNPRKWNRYLKKTLFHKLLNEVVAA